jgi:hypothetical protein
MLWIFNQTGMDNKWVVFSTHSVGYVLLSSVIVVMILVFGGVVLVWSHLIDFVKVGYVYKFGLRVHRYMHNFVLSICDYSLLKCV